ncbi:MAG: histidine kinase [Clostridia bacterium]|nr:histidine kinase [Clostridia bacterium]
MNIWIESFNFSAFGAAFLLSVMGLWFTVVIPGIDRWSRRFFVSFFAVYVLSCLSGVAEVFLQYYPVPRAVFVFLLILESLLLSLPLLMLTAFLLHCCRETICQSKLLRAVLGLWSVYFILLVSVPFIDRFLYITPDNQYSRGPLCPLPLVPLIGILLLNFAGTLRRRAQLSHKVFLAFLVAILPITLALIVHLCVDVSPLIDVCLILSALAMYSLILSDQIEQDRHHQQEILRQQQEIARQQQEIANERASVMVLQMRPHFICNTLISIHSLCRLDPRKAQQVTLDFTNYLRRNFSALSSDSNIPFPSELEHTRAYLAVEQAQYDELLVVSYDTPFTNFRLPPLTLQPLVENAVKHGMNPYQGPLHISIRTRHTPEGAEITVENDGADFRPADDGEPHIALKNIRQRLKMMCEGKLTLTPRDGGGTVVKLVIP